MNAKIFDALEIGEYKIGDMVRIVGKSIGQSLLASPTARKIMERGGFGYIKGFDTDGTREENKIVPVIIVSTSTNGSNGAYFLAKDIELLERGVE
jgi:hypothetical protein